MSECECNVPESGRIQCSRHGCAKDTTQVQLCQAGGKYWRAWEDCRLADQQCYSGDRVQPLHRHVSGTARVRYERTGSRRQGGPGTELKGLLSLIGIRPARGCKCAQRMREMNREGCDWCAENIETIVDWLSEEADRARLPFLRFAAKKIIRLAIRRARRKEKASPPEIDRTKHVE